MFKVQNDTDLLYHHAAYGGAGSGTSPPLGGKFDVFCLTARFLNGTVCERDFAVKLFEPRISFDTVRVQLFCVARWRGVLYSRWQRVLKQVIKISGVFARGCHAACLVVVQSDIELRTGGRSLMSTVASCVPGPKIASYGAQNV